MKFGDLICYRQNAARTFHDGPLMYVGPCHHPYRDGGGSGLIDILDMGGDGHIEHKDPAMWQRCWHLAGLRDVSGTFSGTLTYDGPLDASIWGALVKDYGS